MLRGRLGRLDAVVEPCCQAWAVIRHATPNAPHAPRVRNFRHYANIEWAAFEVGSTLGEGMTGASRQPGREIRLPAASPAALPVHPAALSGGC